MKIIKLFFALMGATLLSANALADEPLYDENGFAINPENPNQYQEPTVTDGVYQIANAGNLYWFADFVNQGGDNAKANAVLISDIVVNEMVINEDGNVTNGSDFKAWTPIGTNSAKYNGTFDGKGYTVSGLYFNDENTNYVGLFGYISSGATVQNVGVIDSYIRGKNCVGGVVGDNDGGTISNVYNTGSVSGFGTHVGGVVGYNYGGTIGNVYNTGSVSAGSAVGGVVGFNQNGTIVNVYNTGSVSGEQKVGGVVGRTYSTRRTISNVYNTGSVSGEQKVGGVVGFNENSTISNVYNTGSVSGDNYVGGVVGDNGGDINNAYYDKQTCNNCNSYGTGKTLTELASLKIGSKADADFPLLKGETESPWAKNIYYDKATGKLANSELPYLKSLPKPQDVEMEFNVKNNVIQISSTDDLKNFAKLVNEYHITDVDAELTTNLTVNSNLLGENNANVDAETGEYTGNTPANVWTPIGTSEKPYTGTFDGNGNTVSGLYFNEEDTHYVGLFGYIGSGATVQNVGVVDSYFKGFWYVGGVVGYNDGGTVSNAYNTGSVSGVFKVGGVVAYNFYGTVSNVYNTGSVSGDSEVGGVVGNNYYGAVSNVYNTGSVSGNSEVGGVVGGNYGGTVSNVDNTGSVSGSGFDVGGVVGKNDNGTVSTVYNTGSVSGESEVGGVVGFNVDGSVSNVYNTGSVSGNSGVGGVVGNNYGTVSNVYNTGIVSGLFYVGGVVGYNVDGSVSNVYNTGSVSGNSGVGGVVGQNDGTVSNGFFNTAYYSGNAIGGGTGTANTVVGKTSTELANLTVGNGGDFPLLEGETESPWANDISYDKATGKLTSTLPYLKNFPVVPDAETILSFTVASGVIQISTAEDLKNFAKLVNEYDIRDVDAELTTSITLNSNLLGENNANVDAETGEYTGNTPANVWTPIGTNSAKYNGTFDGNGYTIRGLYFNDESTEYVGLFGYIDESAKVQNVGVVDSYFKGYQYVGGVVGYNKGTVSNVYNTGAVSGETFVGGVVGYNDGGTVSNAYNTGSVSGSGNDVGGVVGNNYGTVSNAYNTGSVSGSGDDVGGVVGYSFNGTVSNVYNTGSVSGNGVGVGGVVGNNYGTVSNVYNTGSVSGTGGYVGGVVGQNDGTVSNGFFNTAYYSGNAIGSGAGTADNVKGLSMTDLANLTVGNGGDFPLLEGETETPWVEGSETPVVSNGKLVYKFPGLKIFDSQPEVVLFNVQKGSDGKDYCEIANADDLFKFAQLVNDGATGLNAKLTADICVNGCGEGESVLKADGSLNGDGSNFTPWIPIGTEDQKFKGTFDGAGHTISGLYFNQDESNAGLFGRSTVGGSIKNVGVVDSYIKGKNNVGGIVGHNGNCKVSNVFSTSTVEGGTYVGGIAGYNDAGTIKNAYNMGAVSGNSKVAGIAGYNIGTSAHINNVYSSGTVSGPEGQYVRGLVGYNSESKTKISNAFYNTDVFDGDAVGNVDGTNVEGKTTVELAALTIGFEGADFPLLTDETESPWVEGSGTPVVSNGKLVYKFPGLKIFNSQPEVVLFNVQKGSDGKDYCEIANADDLFKFAQLVNDGATGLNAKLTADICVNGCDEGEKSLLEQVAELEANDELSPESFRQWTPMSVPANVTVAFDGNGHTISGLYINKEKSSQIGLFGQVVGDVSVSNLGVVDFYVNGNGEVGSLAGQVTGKLNIKNCYSAGSVKGVHYIGGIVGVNREGAELKIENSYNESSVNAPSGIVGGLVGENNNYASLTITNSYNAGAVNGNDYVGGLVGDNYSAILTIENSYNAGTVSGDSCVGGLVGVNEDGTLNVLNSFFVETNGDGDGLAGEAKTSDEFANGTVTDLLNTGQSPVVWVQGKEYPILKDNHIHSYENGFCACGNLVQPVQDENGVYQIANAGNLYWFAQYVNQGGENLNANAILVNDIVVNTDVLVDGELNTNKTFREWTPIGISYDNSYKGIFDGNGKTISGLYFDNSDQDYVGLFGSNDEGTIKHVGIVDSYFNGDFYVGGVCGYNNNAGTITNCYNTGVVSGSLHIGGVCGYNYEYNSTITNCYNTGEVSGSQYIGGVCGFNGYGIIGNCYNTGEVNGDSYVGGVCGTVGSYCNIENCYNTGNVSGSEYVGGVCGYNYGDITNCYYLETSANTGIGEGDGEATAKIATQFANGTVAKLLFDGENGEVWGQNTSTDTIPNFSGKIIFTVSVTASDNGTVSDKNGEYEYNTKLAIEAIPNKGYHFVEWSNGSSEIKDTILVVSDTALVATFEAHSFGEWDTTQVATCTEYGLRTRACVCGEEETDTIPASHNVVIDSAKTATCTATGLTEGKHCSVCDSVFVAQQTVAKLAHTVVVDTAKTATCTATGLTEGKHCSVCDSILVAQQTLPALGHKVEIVAGVSATCTATGLTEGKHCSVCDSILVAQQTLPALGHKIETIAGVSPTCTATGLTEGSHCSVCDSIFVAQQTVAKLAHTVVVDTAKTATCTATGLTEGKHCSVCGEVIVKQDTIPASHNVVIDSAKTATCTATGLTEGKHCSVCGEVIVKQDTIPASHNVVIDSAKTATCTATGLTEGKHCSVCGEVIVKQDTIPASHNVVIDSAKTATCTATGLTEGKHCSVCGEVIKAQETIPALGHLFTNYICNNDATTEADGTETAECDREGCNAIDVRTAEGTRLVGIDESETTEVVIYAHHNVIVVENANADIKVFNAMGRCVEICNNVDNVRTEMAMPTQGVYIVKCGAVVKRIVIQ